MITDREERSRRSTHPVGDRGISFAASLGLGIARCLSARDRSVFVSL